MSWFSKINPIPSFPSYTGPYDVGTVDVELPVNELESPCPAPNPEIGTVAYRVFYPCEHSKPQRPIRWLPNPQKGYFSAYARFLGASPSFASVFAAAPLLPYYASIPACRNAPLLSPNTPSKRWPVLVFSHGLGGTRNMYSHLLGSLSSHGVIVIAPEHRDQSAPISYVRETSTTKARTVEYKQVSHDANEETWEQRDEQLKVRLWELGLIHNALEKIDHGESLRNLDPNILKAGKLRKPEHNDVLSMFKGHLDVHEPGTIAWGGHSFGGATTVQFVKSVYYNRTQDENRGHKPLYSPPESSSIAKQVTPFSPVILLDVWCLPIQSPSTRWLREKPLPCYASDGPGGTHLIAILSEAFVKWRSHFETTRRVLSQDSGSKKAPPRFFYPVSSAHLSQSDFGVLFPWLTKKVFKADEPERTLRLNTRAILQVLRDCSWSVADTSELDREEQTAEKETGKSVMAEREGEGQDWKILDTNGAVRGWIALSTTDKEMASGDSTPPEEIQRVPDIPTAENGAAFKQTKQKPSL